VITGGVYSTERAREHFCPWCPKSLLCLTLNKHSIRAVTSKLVSDRAGHLVYRITCERTWRKGVFHGSVAVFKFEVDYKRCMEQQKGDGG